MTPDELERWERARQEKIAAYKRDLTPVIADLRAIGFDLDDLGDWINTDVDYPRAIPVLVKWLRASSNPDIKDSIARCLTVRSAKGVATEALLDEYEKSPRDWDILRWTIGNAMDTVIVPSVRERVLEIVREPLNGASRQMFVASLGHIGGDGVVPALIHLLGDEEVQGHAIWALRRLHPREAREAIEPFLTHPKAWIRTQAKKAIARIDRSAAS